MLPRFFVFLFIFLSAGITKAQSFTNVIVDSNTWFEGECTMLINPANPLHVVAARNPDFLYRSFDGGLTWQDTNMSVYTIQPLQGDVALAIDLGGSLFFQAMDNQFCINNVMSLDGGNTWGYASRYPNHLDKNWLACDRVPGSPYNGRLYTAYWSSYNFGGYTYACLNYSTNGGQAWSSQKLLSQTQTPLYYSPPFGAGLACGPGGSINATWGGGTPNSIRFNKSTDGGNTWMSIPVNVDNNVIPIDTFYSILDHALGRVCSNTSLACDYSGGSFNGNLYCVWSDVRNGANNADVFMATSADGGTTWATQRVNDDLTTRSQVVPTVAVDQSTGWVYVSYLDARTCRDASDDSLHYYLAFSADGGQTFTNVRVSNQYSTISNYHAEYMGMDAASGHIGCLWVGGLPPTIGTQMWYAPITQSQLVGIAEEESDKTPPLLLYPASPNPAIDFTAFDFQLAETDNVTLTITDINGRNITTLLSKAAYTSGRHQVRMQHSEYRLAAGMYVATITTGKHTASRKFTVYR